MAYASLGGPPPELQAAAVAEIPPSLVQVSTEAGQWTPDVDKLLTALATRGNRSVQEVAAETLERMGSQAACAAAGAVATPAFGLVCTMFANELVNELNRPPTKERGWPAIYQKHLYDKAVSACAGGDTQCWEDVKGPIFKYIAWYDPIWAHQFEDQCKCHGSWNPFGGASCPNPKDNPECFLDVNDPGQELAMVKAVEAITLQSRLAKEQQFIAEVQKYADQIVATYGPQCWDKTCIDQVNRAARAAAMNAGLARRNNQAAVAAYATQTELQYGIPAAIKASRAWYDQQTARQQEEARGAWVNWAAQKKSAAQGETKVAWDAYNMALTQQALVASQRQTQARQMVMHRRWAVGGLVLAALIGAAVVITKGARR